MNSLKIWLDSLAIKHTPDFTECVSVLEQYFPLLAQFSNTPQDNIWHAEGDVAIHTNMVLTALYKELEHDAMHIIGQKRQALILAALLHDIAKPLTTKNKEINGEVRVVAPKHEEIAVNYLALKIMALPLDYQVIKTVMGLVGYHQKPKLLVVRNKNYKDYLELSLNVDLELMYWLEVADIKGRICPDLDQQLDLLNQFRMFAEDYELWQDNPKSNILKKLAFNQTNTEQLYINNIGIHQLTKGDISIIEEAIAKNYEPAKEYSHVYLMCGVSGSGKTTWIKKNLDNFEIISLDDIREEINGKRGSQKNRGQMLQLAKKRLKEALAKKTNVVWDATNLRKDFRQIICSIAKNYGALITIVIFQMDEKTIIKQNKDRQHAVDDSVINAQIQCFEWPGNNESHRMIVIGEGGKKIFEEGIF